MPLLCDTLSQRTGQTHTDLIKLATVLEQALQEGLKRVNIQLANLTQPLRRPATGAPAASVLGWSGTAWLPPMRIAWVILTGLPPASTKSAFFNPQTLLAACYCGAWNDQVSRLRLDHFSDKDLKWVLRARNNKAPQFSHPQVCFDMFCFLMSDFQVSLFTLRCP